MSITQTIAIDGPAASGKSTIGKLLADSFGYLFFDTGVMYRAVTWAGLQHSIDINSEKAITALANSIEIDVLHPSQEDGRNCDIVVNGNDITWEIRTPEVDSVVSIVSAYPGVRDAMTERQRQIGLRGRVVMVGRDIGTVVLPEAELKLYLDATVEERANRRLDELQERGEEADYDAILHSMNIRDKIDSTRAIAPLRPAEDAIILSSDGLDIQQVLERVNQIIQDSGKDI